MGDAKRKRILDEVAGHVTKDLIERGMLLEAGFLLYARYLAKDATPAQLDDLKLAYMAGAEHLWSSTIGTLDGGTEPTRADMKRMNAIQAEVDRWRTKLSERLPAKGSG